MSRRARVAAAVVGLLAIAALLLATLHLYELRGLVAPGLAAATGREVTIAGTAKLRPGLRPELRLEGLEIGPTEGSPRLHSARLGRLDVVFALWPLLRGHLEVHALEVDDAEVRVELPGGDDGDEQEADVTEKTADDGDRPFSLKRADVRNLKLELRRRAEEQGTTASIEALSLRSHEEDAVFEVSAAGSIEQIAFDLSGRYDRGEGGPGSGGARIELKGQLAGAQVSGQGSLKDVDGTRSGTLRVRAEAPHLAALSGAAQRELPRLGPVRAAGLLELDGATFGVSELDVHVGSQQTAWLEVTGYARDLRNRRKFSLHSDFGIADVKALGPLVGNPPHIGRVTGKATFHDREGPRRVEEFTLKGGRPGVFEIDAEGRMDDVDAVHGLDARVDLKARDLAVLGELFARSLPPIAPVEFSGKVRGNLGEVTTQHVRARLDETRIDGSFAGSFGSGRRPRFSAKLTTPALHLDDVGIEPAVSDAPEATPAKPAAGRLFAETPIDLGWSDVADGTLSVAAARVLGVGGVLAHDVTLDASLEDGRLSARHVALGFQAGEMRGDLKLDSRASPPTFALNVHATQLDLGQLVAEIDHDHAYSGTVHGTLALQARGASPRALAASLDGEAVVACGRGTIAIQHAGLMTRDVFRAVRSVAGSRKSETLNCFMLDLVLHEGVGMVRTLVLDAQDILVVGEGELNLAAETLDLRLVPKPRNAGLLSTAATVRATGPLTGPKVSIEKGSLVSSSTQAMFKSLVPVGGVQKLWGRIRGKAAPRSPCAELPGLSP